MTEIGSELKSLILSALGGQGEAGGRIGQSSDVGKFPGGSDV